MASNDSTLSSVMQTIQNIEDNTSISLTQYTKKCTVNSRTFIDRTLQDDPILTPLMQNLLNLYTGLILTAINMNAYVTDSKRVRDMINIVSTEGLARYSDDILADTIVGTEGLSNKLNGSALATGLFENPNAGNKYGSAGSILETTPADLLSGRILNLKLGVGDKKLDFNLLVQLNPIYLAPEVVKQFIALNFSPSLAARWAQARAGEISTFKDLILGMDLRRERLKALKMDTTGELQQMLDRQSNSLSDQLLKYAQVTPQKQNIANSILIYDKATFDSQAKASGLKINDFASRQKLLNKTFTMILVVLDSMYNKAEVYFHGLQHHSVFAYDQLKKNANTENTDLIKIMKDYAGGMAPKF